MLDCEADTATLGKTAGKDADNDKPTYVSLLGIHGARDMARRLHREALETLAEFGEPHNACASWLTLSCKRKFLMKVTHVFVLLDIITYHPLTICAQPSHLLSARSCRNWPRSCAPTSSSR